MGDSRLQNGLGSEIYLPDIPHMVAAPVLGLALKHLRYWIGVMCLELETLGSLAVFIHDVCQQQRKCSPTPAKSWPEGDVLWLHIVAKPARSYPPNPHALYVGGLLLPHGMWLAPTMWPWWREAWPNSCNMKSGT